jgi:serine/threonine protein kinase
MSVRSCKLTTPTSAISTAPLANDTITFFVSYVSGGSPLDLVNQRNSLDEFDAQRPFVQLFIALRHFLVHCDVRPDNVLPDGTGPPRSSIPTLRTPITKI